MEREDVIKNYFLSWIQKDQTAFADTFSKEIVYSECYGPEYRGITEVIKWFNDWQEHGSVLTWNIKSMIQEKDMLVAEWYFRCVYDGVEDGFDGVSLVRFDAENKIVSLKEFQSKAEHYYPYGSVN